MARILVISILILGFTIPSWAGKIARLKGKVFVIKEGKEVRLKKRGVVDWGDTIIGKNKKSYIVVKFGKSRVAMKGEFKATLEKTEDTRRIVDLKLGKLRASVNKAKKSPFLVKTRSSVVGVRGTDFFASYNPVLDESEVVCFESSVNFEASDGSSKTIVKAGQWGGIGGRFGKKIAPPLDLPPAVLNSFKADLPLE